MPKTKKMKTEPQKVTLYAGSDNTAALQLIIEPDDIPFIGLSWEATRTGIIEVIPGENGTAIVRPLSKGTDKAVVTGPDGKKAATVVNVIDPVEQIELSVSGNSKPGGKVTVKAVLLPKTAGIKDMEWTVDVDDSVATIDARGRIAISKDAQPGTTITVNCKALGAPEPVTAQTIITVE